MNEAKIERKRKVENVIRAFCKEQDVSHLDLLLVSLSCHRILLRHFYLEDADMEKGCWKCYL